MRSAKSDLLTQLRCSGKRLSQAPSRAIAKSVIVSGSNEPPSGMSIAELRQLSIRRGIFRPRFGRCLSGTRHSPLFLFPPGASTLAIEGRKAYIFAITDREQGRQCLRD